MGGGGRVLIRMKASRMCLAKYMFFKFCELMSQGLLDFLGSLRAGPYFRR